MRTASLPVFLLLLACSEHTAPDDAAVDGTTIPDATHDTPTSTPTGQLLGDETTVGVGVARCLPLELIAPDGTRSAVPASAELSFASEEPALVTQYDGEPPWNCRAPEIVGLRPGMGLVRVRWGEAEGSVFITVTDDQTIEYAFMRSVVTPGFPVAIGAWLTGQGRPVGPLEIDIEPGSEHLTGTADGDSLLFVPAGEGSFIATGRWSGQSAATAEPLRVVDIDDQPPNALQKIEVAPRRYAYPPQLLLVQRPSGEDNLLGSTLPEVGRCYPMEVMGSYTLEDGSTVALPVTEPALEVLSGAEHAHVDGTALCVDEPGPVWLRATHRGHVIESPLAVGGTEIVSIALEADLSLESPRICGVITATMTTSAGTSFSADQRFLQLFLETSGGGFLQVLHLNATDDPTLCVEAPGGSPLTELSGEASFGGSALVQVSGSFAWP